MRTKADGWVDILDEVQAHEILMLPSVAHVSWMEGVGILDVRDGRVSKEVIQIVSVVSAKVDREKGTTFIKGLGIEN